MEIPLKTAGSQCFVKILSHFFRGFSFSVKNIFLWSELKKICKLRKMTHYCAVIRMSGKIYLQETLAKNFRVVYSAHSLTVYKQSRMIIIIIIIIILLWCECGRPQEPRHTYGCLKTTLSTWSVLPACGFRAQIQIARQCAWNCPTCWTISLAQRYILNAIYLKTLSMLGLERWLSN